MQISARNQLKGVIKELKVGKVNTEVIIDSNSDTLTAIITNSACENLNLTKEKEVTAIIKASNFMVAKGEVTISARNKLKGKISTIKVGEVNSEIGIELTGGTKIVAIITNDAKNDLNLNENDSVIAIAKASSVILGA